MNSQRPFDLSKLDFDGIRLRKRKKLLLWSLPVSLMLLVIAIKLISVPIISSVAKSNFLNKRYYESTQILEPLYAGNWLEPYKLYYNQANGFYMSAMYIEAELGYREALKTVPREFECYVRVNLALSIEAQADVYFQEKKLDESILRYDEAKAVLRDGQDSCGVQFDNTSSEPKEYKPNSADKDGRDNLSREDNPLIAQSVMHRVVQKSDLAKQQRNSDDLSESQDLSESGETAETIQEKINKLEQKAMDSQRVKRRSVDSARAYSDYDKNERSYDNKNW